MEDKAPHCGVTHVSAATQPRQEKEEEDGKRRKGEWQQAACRWKPEVEAGGVCEQRVNNVKSREITVLGALPFQRRREDKCMYDD